MSLADDLAAYLQRQWGGAVAVEELSRLSGGASRETWSFDALVDGARRQLILRRDPGGSLIDTDRHLEFQAFRTVHGKLPVPEALLLEADGAELGRPFFIMERVPAGIAASPFTREPYGQHATALGEAFFAHLGDLAAIDPAGTQFADVAPAPALDRCWEVALDYWAGVVDADELHPQPILHAAIRRLRRCPPPPAQRLAIVHGDYRTGNFLHDEAGAITAILDWEMAHLGDPLEDLGWALDPLWRHYDMDRVGGMIGRERALAIWREHSGLEVDEDALAWWSLFNAVKGQAIWTSSAKEYRDGGLQDPVLGLSGWYTARRHDVILADQLLALEDAA